MQGLTVTELLLMEFYLRVHGQCVYVITGVTSLHKVSIINPGMQIHNKLIVI